MAVYITGDIHGNPMRLATDIFPEQKELTKNDYVIILGDFGLIWDYKGESNSEKYKLDWLESKPFTTLFLDGNHECFDRLNSYPISKWHGGNVQYIRPSVIHLMRGEIYNIDNKDFFVFGGASSHDIRDGILEPDDPRIKEWNFDYSKLFRVNKRSWWKEELPNKEEMENGLNNLKKYNNKVDYILTHSPYTSILRQLDGGSGLYQADILSNYLQNIKQNVDFKQWIFGHMHINKNFYWDRTSCLYEQIVNIIPIERDIDKNQYYEEIFNKE